MAIFAKPKIRIYIYQADDEVDSYISNSVFVEIKPNAKHGKMI